MPRMIFQSIVPACDQLLESLEIAALTPDNQQFVKNSVRCLCHENALQSLGLADGSFNFRDYDSDFETCRRRQSLNALSTGEKQRLPNYF